MQRSQEARSMLSFNPTKPKNPDSINVDDIMVGKGHGEKMMTEYSEGENPEAQNVNYLQKRSLEGV